MTAMSDVTVLLLIFFMLSINICEEGSKSYHLFASEIKIPETNVLRFWLIRR